MRLQIIAMTALVLLLPLSHAYAAPPAAADPAGGSLDFSITAGQTFFDHTPTLGQVCTFNFGDPRGAYNVLTGYNAAHVYDAPGTFRLTVSRAGQTDIVKTIRVLADRRPVRTLKAGDDFAEAIRSLHNDSILALPAGATFTVTRPLEIKARNAEIRAVGSGPPPRILRTGVYTSTIYAQGLNTTFRGISFDSDRTLAAWGERKVAYRGITADTAHVSVISCEFHNLDDAIFGDQNTRGLLVQNCKFTNEVRSCDVWCYGGDYILLGNTMATSEQEHNVRSSAIGFTNLLLFQNDLTSTQGKETLTFRVGQDLYAAHNSFHKGWIRTGPGPRPDRAMTAAELRTAFVKHVVLIDNALTDGAWFQINEGSSDVTIKHNRIDCDEKHVPVRLDGPSLKDIRVEDNYRVLKGVPTPKPFVRADRIEPGDLKTHGNKTKLDEKSEAREEAGDRR